MKIVPRSIIARLGQAPDKVLAQEAGVHHTTIFNRRRELGIPAWRSTTGGRPYLVSVRLGEQAVAILDRVATERGCTRAQVIDSLLLDLDR